MLTDGLCALRHVGGEPVDRGTISKDLLEVCGVHGGDLVEIEIRAESLCEHGRARKGFFDRDLLVQHDPE